MRIVGTLFAILVLLSACTQQGHLVLDSTSNSEFESIWPLSSLVMSSVDAENQAKTVSSLAGVSGSYGYVDGNAGLRGRFRKIGSTLLFERTVAAGGAWADYLFFPNQNLSLLRHELGRLVLVSVRIKASMNVDQPTIATACGLAFGFGSGEGHSSAANLGTTLRLGDRDWALSANGNKAPRDYFRVLFETQKDDEKLTVDAPINSYNVPGAWTNFTAAQWRESAGEFNVIRSTNLEVAGDYIEYRQDIEFDVAAGLISVTITPLGSNVDSSAWQAQTVTWDMSQPVGATSLGGSARGGLDLTNVTGPSAMSLAELASESVTIGFVGNMAPRACEFSDLLILRRK